MTTPSSSNSNDITALRDALFETLRGVRSGAVDIDKARLVNELGKTLIDTARVEIDFLKATGGDTSTFLGSSPQPPAIGNGMPSPHNPFPHPGKQHRLQG